MKLRCTIGSQGFVGGPTYREGDEYALEDEEKAKQLIEQGYAEEVQEIIPSAAVSPLILSNKMDKPKKTTLSDKTKTRKRY